jgi:iron complex outermembrane receptor protein
MSWGYTVFNDRGTHVDEDADYVEAVYTKQFPSGILRWSTYYNSDHLAGRFDYPLANGPIAGGGIEDNRTRSWGDWVGSELTYRFDVEHVGTLTAGAEGKIDLRTLQSAQDVSPAPAQFVKIDQRDKSFALFVQDERKLSPCWTLNLGARLDASYYRESFVSPRAALIYRPSTDWTYKFLYGRAFRNPSAFDLFYGDGLSSVANPEARPEKMDMVEIDVERRLGKRMNLLVAGYGYWLHDFLVGVYTSGGLLQTQNAGQIHAAGLELELNGRLKAWLETTASYAFQKSAYGDGNRPLENSPEHLAKVRFAVPLGRKFDASSSMQYYSSRGTLAQALVGPVYLADFTITSKKLLPNFDVQFGIRNAFNWNYSDPIALNGVVDAMLQPGRSVFVELIAHSAQ